MNCPPWFHGNNCVALKINSMELTLRKGNKAKNLEGHLPKEILPVGLHNTSIILNCEPGEEDDNSTSEAEPPGSHSLLQEPGADSLHTERPARPEALRQ